MPTNLELKIKLESFNRTKGLLKKINAKFIRTLNQKDVYYKTGTGLLKLRVENGQQSVIKYVRNEKDKDRFSDYHLLKISDGKAENFFEGIFPAEAVVQKKRILYMFDNTRVHLDTVKNLGYFLELETLVIKGKLDAKKRFGKIIELLQLSEYDEIRNSYRDLILRNKK
ncbi:MAG: class IV adenylate cyclase [Bacteroidetes bacterium]|nr:class IV adenylate cyclase [Bacteroidota bacterium]